MENLYPKLKSGFMASMLSGLVLFASPVGAASLAGAALPDTLAVGGTTLKLNGLGLRKKAMFKVYVGGLYLVTPSSDAAAILGSDQARGLTMYFLRDLSQSQLVEAFNEGFEANASDKTGTRADFERMLALVPDVKEGGTMTFTYEPGTGTTLQAGSSKLGTYAGKPFADAVFSLWLGPEPPSAELKDGMLGK